MTAAPSGLLLVDKPAGFTSHDVIAILRRALGIKRIGHAGTLDPMATGLLVIGVGGGTKFLNFLTLATKRYLATVRLGQQTLTDDAEGEVLEQASAASLARIDAESVDRALLPLSGRVMQVPSSVSAIKTAGVRSYDRVRAGESVTLEAREVEISALRRTSELRPAGSTIDFDIEVSCSSGTYIRAIARDLGAALGVGGHLTALRRTEVGEFSIGSAMALARETAGEEVLSRLLDLASVAQLLMPCITIGSDLERRIRQGQRIALTELPAFSTDGHIAVLSEANRLIAIATRRGEALQPVTVFGENDA